MQKRSKKPKLAEEMKTTIIWNEKAKKFETEDKEAYLEYRLRGDGEKVMDIIHTYVPATKRGLGIAGDLCTAAFTHALNRSMSIIPTCSYISGTFLSGNPNWKSIVYREGGKARL